MLCEQELEILRRMSLGLHPISGAPLPDDHILNSPPVMRALHAAIAALNADRARQAAFAAPRARSTGKLNAGRAWTQADVETLEALFLSGASMREMCAQLHRRERGVRRQLTYLGHIECGDGPRFGQMWTRAEDDQLRKMYDERRKLDEIAREMRRSQNAIYCRMQKRGLYGAEFGYPAPEERKK